MAFQRFEQKYLKKSIKDIFFEISAHLAELKLLAYALKLDEYEENLSICGIRNSYSKTDHDATMMNTKYDYYN